MNTVNLNKGFIWTQDQLDQKERLCQVIGRNGQVEKIFFCTIIGYPDNTQQKEHGSVDIAPLSKPEAEDGITFIQVCTILQNTLLYCIYFENSLPINIITCADTDMLRDSDSFVEDISRVSVRVMLSFLPLYNTIRRVIL